MAPPSQGFPQSMASQQMPPNMGPPMGQGGMPGPYISQSQMGLPGPLSHQGPPPQGMMGHPDLHGPPRHPGPHRNMGPHSMAPGPRGMQGPLTGPMSSGPPSGGMMGPLPRGQGPPQGGMMHQDMRGPAPHGNMMGSQGPSSGGMLGPSRNHGMGNMHGIGPPGGMHGPSNNMPPGSMQGPHPYMQQGKPPHMGEGSRGQFNQVKSAPNDLCFDLRVLGLISVYCLGTELWPAVNDAWSWYQR